MTDSPDISHTRRSPSQIKSVLVPLAVFAVLNPSPLYSYESETGFSPAAEEIRRLKPLYVFVMFTGTPVFDKRFPLLSYE